MKQKQFAAFAVIRHNVATGSEFIDLKSIDETEGGAVLQSHYRRMSDSWYTENPFVRTCTLLIKEK